MLVRTAMTPRAEWISPDVPLSQVALLMRDKGIGCLPVGENDRLIGMITDRDITCRAVAAGADPPTTKTREVMSQGITWCFHDQELDETCPLMGPKQIHHLPVLSRQKRIFRVLSLRHIAPK